MKFSQVLMIFILALLLSCKVPNEIRTKDYTLSIDFEKYELKNGLDVIFHKDTSNPMVAVSLLYHVGSTRETKGKTGLAHYVEHMLFQESENLPKGEFVKILNESGGWYNGGTGNDFTSYYEVFPNDALERVLWMEADRMGFQVNMITEQHIENEKNIILDEKRRNIVSSPYGFSYYTVVKNLYPENHPYYCEVVGETQDIKSIELKDFREFYKKYYAPNNATLVIAGNFEMEKTKKWIEKYFGEIPSSENIEKVKTQEIKLHKTKVICYEDDKISTPEIEIVFPTISGNHKDSYALNLLGILLYEKLYDSLLNDFNIAQLSVYNWSREVAGTFRIKIRAEKNVNLNILYNRVKQFLNQIDKGLFSEYDLERIKNNNEFNFYNNNQSIYQKATILGNYNMFYEKPDYYKTELENERKVTIDELFDVYIAYIKNKNHLVSNVVPIGRSDLSVNGAVKFEIPEHETNLNYTKKSLAINKTQPSKTPSKIDRSIKPLLGKTPKMKALDIWTHDFKNKLHIRGISNNDLPLVNFSFIIKGGHLLDEYEKSGTASILAKLLKKGTLKFSEKQILEKLYEYAANLNISTKKNHIKISVSCLSNKYEEILILLKEILLFPKLSSFDFEKAKEQNRSLVEEYERNAKRVAHNRFAEIILGTNHIWGTSVEGTVESLKNIERNDIINYHQKYFVPNNINIQIAGNIHKAEVIESFNTVFKDWKPKDINIPEVSCKSTSGGTHFINISGLEKTVLFAGKTLELANKNDYFDASFANYGLGGNTNRQLFTVLRNLKNLTYNVFSEIEQNTDLMYLSTCFDVSPENTKEAYSALRAIFEDFYTKMDTSIFNSTKTTLLRKAYLKYETIEEQLDLLENIALRSLSNEIQNEQYKRFLNVQLDDIKRSIENHFKPEDMIYIVVGDSANLKENNNFEF